MESKHLDGNKVILKHEREKSLKNRHPWIFSGAIHKAPEKLEGDIYPVYSSKEELLGSAYFNKKSQIIGRMIAWKDENPEASIRKRIQNALGLREFNEQTSGYRLINGEGDYLPGLIVDKYDDVLVMQITTMGMEKLKPLILEELTSWHKGSIYEKSSLPSRKEEGLPPSEGWLKGEKSGPLIVKENGMSFFVDVVEGQKTGFFLDQRENRARIQALSKGKKVLNCFSYTGGFTLAALQGGALLADSVDLSEKACELVKQNIALNNFKEQNVVAADVFTYLREQPLDYDIVILDPPAFAKRQKDVMAACRGYKDINRVAMSKMPKGSLLLTCSCSHFVDEDLFQKVIFQASIEAGRECRIVGRHLLASDHPVDICHPEGGYLKSLLLQIL